RDNTEFKADSLYSGVCILNRYFIEKFKETGSFSLHDDFEFASFHNILHLRMRELEEIYNGAYQDADLLSNDEMEQIFRHYELDKNILIRLFHIMASHFEEYQNKGFNLLIIHDKTYKSRYYHCNTSESGYNIPSQIIPPDKLGQMLNQIYFYKSTKTQK
ncbi:11362_t:CDS:2, partial [Racocetra fulgida]